MAVKIASAIAAKRPKKGEFNGAPYYEFERGGERMVVVPALGHPNKRLEEGKEIFDIYQEYAKKKH